MNAASKRPFSASQAEIDPVVRFDRRRDNDRRIRPTIEAYGAWQYAFEYFNATLFDAALPDALITLTRKARAWGYFCADRFENDAELTTHEISMNPALLKHRDDRAGLSTFVHEMVHLWRHVLGPLNRRGGRGSNGYHDLVWANKMEELGLLPTSTGKFGQRLQDRLARRPAKSRWPRVRRRRDPDASQARQSQIHLQRLRPQCLDAAYRENQVRVLRSADVLSGRCCVDFILIKERKHHGPEKHAEWQ